MSLENGLQRLNKCMETIDNEVSARKRLALLFDKDSFVELDALTVSSSDKASVVAGYGFIGDEIVYAYSQDITVSGGAVSKLHAKKIRKIYELATKTGCPVVAIYDSKGAKLSEGSEMMSTYSEILMWTNNLSGVVPQIAVVLGTCGGTSAMLACSADFVVMSEKAELFLNAPFVAKAKGDKTPNAGSASNAYQAGIANVLGKDDAAALNEVRKLITLLPQNNLAPTPIFDFAKTKLVNIDDSTPICEVVEAIADDGSVFELSGGFGKGIYTAFATLAGCTTAFVAVDKSQALGADACSKAARFVKVCDSFNVPIVTLVDTVGFEMTSNISLIKEAAKLASAYAEATTPKVSVIIGDAIGAAYIALGSKNSNADVSFAWPNAVISPLAPEAAVQFLWADKLTGKNNQDSVRATLAQEYKDTVASPFELAENGYIEGVIAPNDTRLTILNMIDMLAGKRECTLPKKHNNN